MRDRARSSSRSARRRPAGPTSRASCAGTRRSRLSDAARARVRRDRSTRPGRAGARGRRRACSARTRRRAGRAAQCARPREPVRGPALRARRVRRAAARARAGRAQEPAPRCRRACRSRWRRSPSRWPARCTRSTVVELRGARVTILGAGSLGLMLCALVASRRRAARARPAPERLAWPSASARRAPCSPRAARADVARGGGADLVARGGRAPRGVGARGGDGRARRHGQPVRRLRPRQHLHRADRARALRGGDAHSAPTTTRRATSPRRCASWRRTSTPGRSCSGRRSRSTSSRTRWRAVCTRRGRRSTRYYTNTMAAAIKLKDKNPHREDGLCDHANSDQVEAFRRTHPVGLTTRFSPGGHRPRPGRRGLRRRQRRGRQRHGAPKAAAAAAPSSRSSPTRFPSSASTR